jgi:hypothetical protein
VLRCGSSVRLVWAIVHMPTIYLLLEFYAVKHGKQAIVFPRNKLPPFQG